MRQLLLLTILLTQFPSSAFSQKRCECKATDRFGYGGHETITFEEKRIYQGLEGMVMDASASPLQNAVVEVFPVPDKIGPNNAKRRVTACLTGTDGRFCFPHFKAGKYRVSVSAEGFKVTDVILTVDASHWRSRRKGLDIILQVGT